MHLCFALVNDISVWSRESPYTVKAKINIRKYVAAGHACDEGLPNPKVFIVGVARSYKAVSLQLSETIGHAEELPYFYSKCPRAWRELKIVLSEQA